MKLGQPLRFLFWATLYCLLYLVSGSGSSDEDLMDFDFTDLKEIDWNYEAGNSKEFLEKSTTEQNKITFDNDDDLLEENQVHPFDWREKVLRTALSKALANKAVRQKFIEVMPILRVLSKQQRLALSALITAQINAKKGNELKWEQVRMMFGDDRSLILPIVYDIANLVRNSAQKYIEFDYNLADFGDFSKTKISYERRNLDLSSAELAAEAATGTLPATAQMRQELTLDGLEDFMSEEVLDPKEINEELETLKLEQPVFKKNNSKEDLDNVEMDLELEDDNDNHDLTDPMDINHELQKDVPTLTLLKLNKTQVQEMLKNDFNTTQKNSSTATTLKRLRRSARNSREFVHKLVRSVPLTANEENLQRSQFGRNLKLNTTAFASPKETTVRVKTSLPTTEDVTTTTTAATIIVTPENMQDENYEPYQLVEDMAFASLNDTETFLNTDDNTDDNDLTSEAKTETDDEILPTPEELIAGPRYRIAGNKLIPMRSKAVPAKRKRVQIRAHPKQGTVGNGVPAPRKCERFTASMCIKTDDYPIDLIMGSIRRHRNAMIALLAEYSDKPLNALDTTEDFDEYLFAKKRREDNDVQGGLCQSIVRYARPQKARSASGEWKYIVNTGQHTQTLRLEKCTNPQESCNYLSSTYRSHCAQVYNYHRLLSWDKTRGLHVDIFKVPTCCSCQIDGYKHQFPGLTSVINKDFSPVYKSEGYRPHQSHQTYHNDDEELEEDDFDFGIQHQYHQHDASFDANEVSSNRIRTKIPTPTVGSYLSPPENEEYEQRYNYKTPRDTASMVVQQNPTSYSSISTQTSSKNYAKELPRRRPQKSYSDSRSDQDYSPSEQHADRELKPSQTVLATAALHPSQLAPEPFVPSAQYPHHHQHQSTINTHELEDPPSLIPMPTKSQQLQQQQQVIYQHHHQQPQSQSHYPHHQMEQHHYRPTTTPVHDMSSKTNLGYVYQTRSRQPTRELMAKRQRIRLNTSGTTGRQQQQQHLQHHQHQQPHYHRSSRMFML